MRKLKLHPCGNFKAKYEQELTVFETDFGRVWLWVGLFGLFVTLFFHIHRLNPFGTVTVYRNRL